MALIWRTTHHRDKIRSEARRFTSRLRGRGGGQPALSDSGKLAAPEDTGALAIRTSLKTTKHARRAPSVDAGTKTILVGLSQIVNVQTR